MKILVSACLLGENCKYNGGNNYNEKIAEFLKGHEVVSVCPEKLAGLGTPRERIEILDGKVFSVSGKDLTKECEEGALKAYKIAKSENIDLAILQQRSPSCGAHQIYDGTFSKKLIEGQGIFTKKLIENGFLVMDSSEFE